MPKETVTTELEELREAVRGYLSECDSPTPDLRLKRFCRERMRDLVRKK